MALIRNFQDTGTIISIALIGGMRVKELKNSTITMPLHACFTIFHRHMTTMWRSIGYQTLYWNSFKHSPDAACMVIILMANDEVIDGCDPALY